MVIYGKAKVVNEFMSINSIWIPMRGNMPHKHDKADDEHQQHLPACTISFGARPDNLLLTKLASGTKLTPSEEEVQELSVSKMLELIMKEAELEEAQDH